MQISGQVLRIRQRAGSSWISLRTPLHQALQRNGIDGAKHKAFQPPPEFPSPLPFRPNTYLT